MNDVMKEFLMSQGIAPTVIDEAEQWANEVIKLFDCPENIKELEKIKQFEKLLNHGG